MIVSLFPFQCVHFSSSSQLFHGSVDDIWGQGTKQGSEGICLCAELFLQQLKNHITLNYMRPLKTFPSELWNFRGAECCQPCCLALPSNFHVHFITWSKMCVCSVSVVQPLVRPQRSIWLDQSVGSLVDLCWTSVLISEYRYIQYQLVMSRDSYARSGNAKTGKAL